MPSHYGVVYNPVTLEPLRVIVPTDPKSLFNGTHKADPGELFCTVAHEHIAHLIPDLTEMAKEAIRRHRL